MTLFKRAAPCLAVALFVALQTNTLRTKLTAERVEEGGSIDGTKQIHEGRHARDGAYTHGYDGATVNEHGVSVAVTRDALGHMLSTE